MSFSWLTALQKLVALFSGYGGGGMRGWSSDEAVRLGLQVELHATEHISFWCNFRFDSDKYDKCCGTIYIVLGQICATLQSPNDHRKESFMIQIDLFHSRSLNV